MASPPILDFDRLLSPINGDDPAGADLRWEPIYQQIKEARPKVDRDAFGLSEEELVDWNPVVNLTTETLSDRSKDLMIAAWLCEALVHLHGFAGFRDGIKLLNALLSDYWDGLYPRPQDGDLEPRAAPLLFLTMPGRGAQLPNMLREAPLTPDREPIFSWNYWKSRQQKDGESVDAFAQRAEEVAEKSRLFDQAVANAPLEFARTLLDDMQEAHAELVRFAQITIEKFGDVAPGTTAIRAALDECLSRAKISYKDRIASDVPDDEVAAAEGNGQAAGGGGSGNGPIRSREDAFRKLAEVANFLRQKEPQNPIYLLVERAVLWSRMPFEQLLTELIKDAGARDQVTELLGIRPPPEN